MTLSNNIVITAQPTAAARLHCVPKKVSRMLFWDTVMYTAYARSLRPLIYDVLIKSGNYVTK